MKKVLLTAFLLGALTSVFGNSADSKHTLWSIGKPDKSTAELALGPNNYKQFLANDFGFEDKYFLIGKSNPNESFPYVIPGPADEWGGTWSTAGWRTHETNLLFGIEKLPAKGVWKLIIEVADNAVKKPPLLKVSINDKAEKFQLAAGGNDSSIVGDLTGANHQTLVIPIQNSTIREGGNCITLSVLEGSWILFDNIRLEAPVGTTLVTPGQLFVRSVQQHVTR